MNGSSVEIGSVNKRFHIDPSMNGSGVEVGSVDKRFHIDPSMNGSKNIYLHYLHADMSVVLFLSNAIQFHGIAVTSVHDFGYRFLLPLGDVLRDLNNHLRITVSD